MSDLNTREGQSGAAATVRHQIADELIELTEHIWSGPFPFKRFVLRLVRWYFHQLADRYDRRYGAHRSADGGPI